MDQKKLDTILDRCFEISRQQSFITVDDLMDILDEFNVPITKIDYVTAAVNATGLRVFDHTPTKEELLSSQEDDDTNDLDYAQSDYEQLFAEVLEIDPGLEGLISYIRNVRPAQHGEPNYIYRHISDDGKRRLFDMSLRSVVRIAFSVYKIEGGELSDLIQEGARGLLNAIEKYNVDDNSVFGSYANYWVFQFISRSTVFRGNGCYFPVHMSDTIKQVVSSLKKMGILEFDEALQHQENVIPQLCLNCDIDEAQAKKILSYLQKTIAIDDVKEREDYGDLTFSDHGSFESFLIDSVDLQRKAHELNRIMTEVLREKEREVIKLRYGFYSGRCYTLEECGTVFNVTRERIRQIEAKALRKLTPKLSKRFL